NARFMCGIESSLWRTEHLRPHALAPVSATANEVELRNALGTRRSVPSPVAGIVYTEAGSGTLRRPERYLAGRPTLVVTVVFVQIVVTLVLVGALARRDPSSTSTPLGSKAFYRDRQPQPRIPSSALDCRRL